MSITSEYEIVNSIYVREGFGKQKIGKIHYSDVKKFYYELLSERGLKPRTLDGINTVVHGAFKMAVRDEIVRGNPTEGVMAEIKKSDLWVNTRKDALTLPQQKEIIAYMEDNHRFTGWVPIITVLLGTGMRIGDFYILPSNIHEVLIVPDNGEMGLKDLEAMVKEVNATQVAPADKLTDSVYHYDSQAKIFELGEKFVARQAEKEEEYAEEKGEKSVLGELKAKKEEVAKAPKKETIDKGANNLFCTDPLYKICRCKKTCFRNGVKNRHYKFKRFHHLRGHPIFSVLSSDSIKSYRLIFRIS